jgi:hypothetical protein
MRARSVTGWLASVPVVMEAPRSPGEQNLADRVVEVEVALCMQKMRGQQPQLAAAQRQASAFRHGNDAVFRLAHLGEMRGKAFPDARDDQLARVLVIQRSSEAMMSGSACEAIR